METQVQASSPFEAGESSSQCGCLNLPHQVRHPWKSRKMESQGDASSSRVKLSHNHSQEMDELPSGSLIRDIGRDASILCLLHCSRSEYGRIAMLSRSFRNLIRSGELYRLRRQHHIVEHWLYLSCNQFEWVALDPVSMQWMHLPRMITNECFLCSDKESLAVGTELLVFGKELNRSVVYRYAIVTNSWSCGIKMNSPRCSFGAASLEEFAIVAGGCNSHGVILKSAELYNSETSTWMTLPEMNLARKLCSGVFMDGKFYVLGGIGCCSEILESGEEYDLQTRKWRIVKHMYPQGPTCRERVKGPPKLAVVNNQLYEADTLQKEVRKYVKELNVWVTIGRLPQRSVEGNLGFKAIGDRLIIVCGSKALGGGTIELYSWVVKEGAPKWELLSRKQLGNNTCFCEVMGC